MAMFGHPIRGEAGTVAAAGAVFTAHLNILPNFCCSECHDILTICMENHMYYLHHILVELYIYMSNVKLIGSVKMYIFYICQNVYNFQIYHKS